MKVKNTKCELSNTCYVFQSFCAALHEELTEYYRLIAVLEAQVRLLLIYW